MRLVLALGIYLLRLFIFEPDKIFENQLLKKSRVTLMSDYYLFNKKDKKIFCLKIEEAEFNLLEEIFKQKGFEVIYVQNIKELLTSPYEENKNQEQRENPFSKNLEFINENIPSNKLMDFFYNLQFSIKPFISILNAMNINFCLCDEEHFILCNNKFLDTIQYKKEELKEISWKDIVFERDRKHLKEKLEQDKVQNIINHECDLDLHVVTRKKEIKFLKCYIFRINIEGKIFFVNYCFNQEDFQDHSDSIWYMNKLIVNELNNIFINQIRINSVNICLTNNHGKVPIDGRSVPLDDSLDINITKRELEIIRLVYNGHSNQEISGKLFISPRTVEYHRSNLLKKTYSKNTADLIRFAIERNLISTS